MSKVFGGDSKKIFMVFGYFWKMEAFSERIVKQGINSSSKLYTIIALTKQNI